MSNQEIYAAYLAEVEARKAFGFKHCEGLAVEDTAMLYDLSIKQVVLAISVCR